MLLSFALQTSTAGGGVGGLTISETLNTLPTNAEVMTTSFLDENKTW